MLLEPLKRSKNHLFIGGTLLQRTIHLQAGFYLLFISLSSTNYSVTTHLLLTYLLTYLLAD